MYLINERDVETRLDKQLSKLGWIDDITNSNRNVFKQGVKTEEQRKALKGKVPDYVLYQTNSTSPIAVIEAKRPGRDAEAALKQCREYAEKLNAPIIYTTDGIFTKTLKIPENKPLIYNGNELDYFLPEKLLMNYISTNDYLDIDTKVIKSRTELIGYFKKANDILKNEGLEKGMVRFSEFSNLLFLKILTENKNNNVINVNWYEDIAILRGSKLINKIHESFNILSKTYKAYNLFSNELRIKSNENVEQIVDILNPIKLSTVDIDLKGDSFEYFLHSYSRGSKNDLGQYFTPRHIVKLMVKLLNPQLNETIYDPFCGTGGMLIECFKFIKNNNDLDTSSLNVLKAKTLYGADVSDIVKISKMNMILFGDGHANIEQQDSLSKKVENKYDITITNIPFSQESDHGRLYDIPTNNGDSLCVQHCLSALKDTENARACIIVPIGFIHKPELRKEREYILDNYKLEKVIDLPSKVFQPYTNQHTAILYIRNKKFPSQNEKSYFYYKVKNDGFTQNAYRTKLYGYNDLDKVGDDIYDRKIPFKALEDKSKTYKFKQLQINYLKNEYPLKEFISVIKKGASISPNNDPQYFEGGEANFVMVNDLSRNGTQYCLQKTRVRLNQRAIDKYRPHLFREQDILMSSSGIATLLNHRALLGRESYISSTITGIRANDKLDPYYLFYCLKNFDSADILYDEGYPGIQIGKLGEIPIKTLKDNEMENIVSKITRLVALAKEESDIKMDIGI